MQNSLVKILQLVHGLCYAFCLPLHLAELHNLTLGPFDAVIYILLSVILYFTFHKFVFDLYNASCIYGIFVHSHTLLGEFVAIMYFLLYFYERCIPCCLVNSSSSCALCQYLLAFINLFTVKMLHIKKYGS